MQIGFLVFPKVQQLDITGPYEVFASWPGARVRLVWRTLDPVKTVTGLSLAPDTDLTDCPQLDVLCVPGGAGINTLLTDQEAIAFLRRQAERVRFVTSVCTGALLLGVAGLLKGKRATTHWASHHLLERLGAVPVQERVVRDGKLMTGGGVAAGVDFALALLAELAGSETAEAIQLNLEYAPAPPFNAGSPETAPEKRSCGPSARAWRRWSRSARGLSARRRGWAKANLGAPRTRDGAARSTCWEELAMSGESGQTAFGLSVIIPWILTLVRAATGIWQFTVQQSQANRQPFLQKQLELGFEATEAAARLATETNPEEWEKARARFWQLYWGPLSVVEDPTVESKMVDFGKLVPDQPVNSPKLPMSDLRDPSYELAHAVRDLVLASWNVNLPPLQGARLQ